MKRIFLFWLMLCTIACASASAQIDEATRAKRETRKNMVVREWNTDPRTKTRWLDRVTTYDALGRKIEEIEYTKIGQKWRETYEYGEDDRISKDVLYNERDKVVLVRKYEYNPDGSKKKQFNYAPNGKLETVKVFEYATSY